MQKRPRFFLRGLVSDLGRELWLRGQATAVTYRLGLNMSKPPRLDRQRLCRERWLRERATAATYLSSDARFDPPVSPTAVKGGKRSDGGEVCDA